MRVLHLFKNYYPPTFGGVEQWINDVVHARELHEAGISFDVLTTSTDRTLRDSDDDGVRVVRVPALVRASTAPVVPSWPSWIRRLRPDVLHVNMPNPTGEMAVMASRFDGPIVATYHADIVRRAPVPQLYERFLRRFLKRVQRVTVGSQRLADSVPALREMADRVTILPYGVDVGRFSDRPALTDELRAKFGPRIVVCLGRLVHYKGVDMLVEAMQHVDATALIVGDGPLRAQAEAKMRQLGLGDRVKFIGNVDDADRAAYYHAADLFVLPAVNRGESYGIVQAEAMSTGTPSISTELGTGTSWVNQHGQTGLVVPPRDPRALAAAINELLADDDRRLAMGEAARRRVHDHLTREHMLTGLRELYENAAQAR